MKKPKGGGDATGPKRGARGFGKLDATDVEFLRPNFDREKQQGPLGVGMYPSVVTGNAHLEGDEDIDD